MKKNVIVCGLIGGLIISIGMIIGASLCEKNANYEASMLLGYATQIVAFSLIFVGIKNQRDKINGGSISFGEAFKIGLFISLIASTLYVLVWLVDFYVFIPDFMEKYSAHQVKALRESSISEKEMAIQLEDLNQMKELYKNPLMVFLITYVEVLPLALVLSLIAAAILRRKKKPELPA
ncbi:DUF4199 domain-containing protein [Sphingobacteriaceae bacterium]|nr:DUF4199 domain-containing protein [Sphingobacteriaceae bacterium]